MKWMNDMLKRGCILLTPQEWQVKPLFSTSTHVKIWLHKILIEPRASLKCQRQWLIFILSISLGWTSLPHILFLLPFIFRSSTPPPTKSTRVVPPSPSAAAAPAPVCRRAARRARASAPSRPRAAPSRAADALAPVCRVACGPRRPRGTPQPHPRQCAAAVLGQSGAPAPLGMPTNVFQTSASADERIQALVKEVELECGDISSSQEDLLARSSFLGGDGEEEETEVFSTPLTQGQQSQQGQGEEEEDAITMSTLPFTQPSPSSSPWRSSPEGQEEDEELADSKMRRKEPRKPRICTRKVRGARIRTPTPSPSPDRRRDVDPLPSPDRRRDVDPLYKAVLMIPTSPVPTAAGDLLALARQRGIF
ncbi:hypothetical protein EJB05_30611, partial [Eragrostis curvula]